MGMYRKSGIPLRKIIIGAFSMGGFFGVVSKDECVNDLYFGTDYHSRLSTKRGGLAVLGKRGFKRSIHDISNTQFRSKFDGDLPKFNGRKGIGVISDYEDQPLIFNYGAKEVHMRPASRVQLQVPEFFAVAVGDRPGRQNGYQGD